jgi:homoserine kinase
MNMKKRTSIKVFAPATVANVACGFDIFGFAIDRPGDEVVVRLRRSPGVVISKITGDGGRLPLDPARNTAGVAVKAFLERIGSKAGFELEVHKKMPLGSGLGSSAASAVAGLFGANELLGRPLQRLELLPFAMEGERAACGTPHADNAGPCLLGGFVLIRSYAPLDVVKIPTPRGLYCTVVHPHIEIRTEDARGILKKEIGMAAAITQWGNIAGLVAGLMKPDLELIRRSMNDVIIEPVRSVLIPGFEEAKKAALGSGALGFSISGSGPSVFAISPAKKEAAAAGKGVQRVFGSVGIKGEVFVSKINDEGVRIA